jgi:hypothetical protein
VYLCGKLDGTPFHQQHDELFARQYADVIVLVLTQDVTQRKQAEAALSGYGVIFGAHAAPPINSASIERDVRRRREPLC